MTERELLSLLGVCPGWDVLQKNLEEYFRSVGWDDVGNVIGDARIYRRDVDE